VSRDELITALLARWAMANPGEATTPSSLADYRDQIARSSDEQLQAMWHGLIDPPGMGPRPAPTQIGMGPQATPTAFPVDGVKGDVQKHWGENTGGTDIFAPRGTPVRAVRSGVVTSAGSNSVGGNYVQLKGDDGLDYYMAHLDTLGVQSGQRVDAGFQLGTVGNTGNASSGQPHLHIGIGHGIVTGTGPAGGTGANFNAVDFLNQIDRAPGAQLGGGQAMPPTIPGTNRIQYSPFDETFMKYMPADLQADDTFRAIVAAASKAESGWDPNKIGDGGKSVGLFQMHEAGAGAGMGDARRDPDAAAQVMVPKFAEAYRLMKQRFPGADPAHLAALVAGYAERPQGTDANGILAAGSAAYNNYRAAWNDVSGGGGSAARPPAGAAPSIRLTPVTGDMLGTPQGISQGIFDTWTSAMQQVEGLDPLTDAPKIKAIMDAAKAQTDVLTWYQDRADKVGYQNAQSDIARGHLALGQQQLAQQGQQFGQTLAQNRDFHNDDVRLAIAKLAQSDQQFMATHGLAVRQFEELALPTLANQQRQTGADITGVDPVTGLPTQNARVAEGQLTGTYNGQPTIAARTLEEQIAQHRDTLRAGFADLTSRQAQAQEEAQRMAEVEKGKLLGQALPTGTEFVPGMEPGGTGAQIASMLGTAFTPTRYTPTFVDPGAGLDALRAAFERARQTHPGAPVPT
jgi:hypothetical protein